MKCSKHDRTECPKGYFKCKVLVELGYDKCIPASGPESPCQSCIKQWDGDNEPTKENPTPIINKVLNNNIRATTGDMISSYIRSVSNYIKKGAPSMSEEDYQARLKICQSCEHLKDNRCNLCGCSCAGGFALTAKLRNPTESCPIDKWKELV